MPEIRYSDGSVRRGESVPSDALPDLGLAGRDLTHIGVDHQVRLRFDDVEVVIETPFSLSNDGVDVQFDPDVRVDLGPVLALFPGALEAAAVDVDLTLRLSFQGGAGLAVPQHPQYEAWHVEGPGNRLIVCPPVSDRTLAVWH